MKRLLWQHGWKLLLVPVFLDVPREVKYACAALVLASLVVDVALLVRERRGRPVAARRNEHH